MYVGSEAKYEYILNKTTLSLTDRFVGTEMVVGRRGAFGVTTDDRPSTAHTSDN